MVTPAPQPPAENLQPPTLAVIPIAHATPIPVPVAPTPMPLATTTSPTPPPAISEWQVLADQGDKLLAKRQRREAATVFERALNAAETTAPPVEVARLCQKLASIQAIAASSSEARSTLQRGLQILKKIKGGPDQTKLADEMESQLRSLPRD
jgi:hypothetical protein